jgi:PLP dependent protein
MRKQELRKQELAGRWERVQREMAASSAPGTGRRPRLVAVSKTFPVDDILVLYEMGQRDFGENRVEEMVQKASDLGRRSIRDINWHFLGQVQSKKLKPLLSLPGLAFIHSVHSQSCLNKILLKANFVPAGRSIGLYLQVNTSGEEEKQGFSSLQELCSVVNDWQAAASGRQLHQFFLAGLMTMGKIRTEHFAVEARRCFEQLREWRGILQRSKGPLSCELSMGMSQDYPLALAVGTDVLRLGSVLFGERE